MKKNKIFTGIILVLLVLGTNLHADRAPCLNPIKNIDWKFFADKLEFKFKLCSCDVPGNELATQAGFAISFFEPIAALESTSNPWSLPCIGIDLDKSFLKKYGTSRTKTTDTAFKHAHFIIYPIFSLFNLMQDYICFERAGILNFAFISEVMPQYNNDVYATFVNPDKLLFANPVAEVACIADCLSSTVHESTNSLYWCTGCWQTTATNTGFIDGQQPIIDGAVLAARVIDSMHQYYGLTKTSNATFAFNMTNGILKNTMCEEGFFPRIIKSQYRLQLAYPSTWDTKRIGAYRSWADFKNYPTSEDDTVFFLWRKRDMCAGAYDCKSTFTGL